MTTTWEELVSESYYETIDTVKERIQQYDLDDALIGLNYLYLNMAKKDQREFRTFLILAMMHILKWKHQPQKQSTSWVRTIRNARKEMEVIREDVPSINETYVQNVWEQCFQSAVEDAKFDMGIAKKDTFTPELLTWEEVFEKEYSLDNE